MPEIKRRARRIASDEAHAWARNLRLRNAGAKYVLCMLTLYVNGDGACWVSINQLAEDCELASETIRRRLAWLETIGAVLRRAQWIDEHGKRNGDGRGRRTSDDILLLVDSDPNYVENNAISSGDDVPPLSEGGATAGGPDNGCPSADPPVSPLVAPSLRTGPESSEHEPEQEESPLPPKTGGDEEFSKRAVGGERLRLIEPLWPEAITDAHRAVNVLSSLSEAEWQQCLTGAKGYARFIRNRRESGKPRLVKDFHNWARNQQWRGFVTAGEEAEKIAERKTVAVDSPEGRAWGVLCRVAHVSLSEFRGHCVIPHELSPQLLALAEAPKRWQFIAESEVNQVGAWRALIARELADRARPELIDDRSWRGYCPTRTRGFLAPWPWPPRKDGSTATGPPPTDPLSDEDMAEIKKHEGNYADGNRADPDLAPDVRRA